MLLVIERSTAAASAALYDVPELPPRTPVRSLTFTGLAAGDPPVPCAACLTANGSGTGDAWPMVRDLLQMAGARPEHLTAFVAGVGPGSFSGIRSALALLRGLALPTGRPVAGVSTAAAAARAWRIDHPDDPGFVRVLGDARRGHIWCFQEIDDPAELTHTAADFTLYTRPGTPAAADDAAALPPLSALPTGETDGPILLADPARLAPLFPAAPPAVATAQDLASLALAGLYAEDADPIYLHPAVGNVSAV